jgi:hypothetical protein
VEDARIAGHRRLTRVLAGLDDGGLAERLAGATELGTGIGGRTSLLRVDDLPVFVKRVPLTDLELRPERRGSTANLFELPTFYQYGVGSTGFGAWREVAAHTTMTEWVLDGRSPRFPLLYHWRVLPERPRNTPADEITAAVAYWNGSPAVRRRLEAIAGATASVVLVLEHLPQTLNEWLLIRFDEGESAAAAAVDFADRELHALVDVLQAHGVVHFDAHPHNVLTDGRRLYLGDPGLLLDLRFELAEPEAAFLAAHRDWDRYDIQRYLVNWLCRRLQPDVDRRIVIHDPAGLPAHAAALIARYRAPVQIMNAFYDRLVHGPKTTPYPAAALAAAAGRGYPAQPVP